MGVNRTSSSKNESACRELIVYACPTGELAAGLEHYFAATMYRCGSNTAHEYMPHCTLTGFFHDDFISITSYVRTMEMALAQARANKPEPAIAIAGMTLEPTFHYLAVRSPWLEMLTATFAKLADSSTRIDELRLKTNLHVSLAYGFEPQQEKTLRDLASELDWQVPVGWEVRFYERHSRPDGSSAVSRQEDLERRWTCHGCWEV